MPTPDSRRRAIALLVVIVLIGGALFLLANRPEESEQAIDGVQPRETPSAEPAATARRRPRASAGDEASVQPLARSSFPGLGVQPGLLGESQLASLPEHDMTIRITSAAPIGQIAYVVPTNAENQEHEHVEQSTSWSTSMKVYGAPDYAAVFTLSGYQGHAITTTITIDGRVTEQCVSRGPFSATWCQG